MIPRKLLSIGVNLITFPTKLEYSIFQDVVSGIEPTTIVIHSKPPVWLTPKSELTLVDATGHLISTAGALRRKMSHSAYVIPNPGDVKMVLSKIRDINRTTKCDYWIWWTPSDLLAHGLEDVDIAKCLRVINSEFKRPFLAMVARDVHSDKGVNLMGLVSMTWFDIKNESEKEEYRWSVAKHFNSQIEEKVFTIEKEM